MKSKRINKDISSNIKIYDKYVDSPLYFGDITMLPVKLDKEKEGKLIYKGYEPRPVFVLSQVGNHINYLVITGDPKYEDNPNYVEVTGKPLNKKSYIKCIAPRNSKKIYEFPIYDKKNKVFIKDENGNYVLSTSVANSKGKLDGTGIKKVKEKLKELYGAEERNEIINETFDLEEEIKVNDTLNPDLWENDELKEDVSEHLLDIADAFVDKLKEDDINLPMVDVRLLGSNANYNYTKDSDIDLHIVTDLSKVDVDPIYLARLYDAYKSLFNKKFDIKVKGHEVEVYVEDINSPAKSNGVYSLYTGWVKKPDKTLIPEIDWKEFEKVFDKYEDKYFAIMKEVKYESKDNLEESSSFRRHLKDCIGNVEYFVVYDNIKDMHFEEDVLDEEWDESDAFWYLQQNDDILKQLSKDDVEKIDNVELLDRLFKLDANKLSKEQQDKMKEIYKQKVIISKEDVEKLLEEFRQCKDIYDNGYKKTRTFLRNYDLTLNNCLEIIHNLKVSDYCANTKSINLNHIGNNLIIFEPKNVKLTDGRELGDFIIYVKLDVDESTKNVVSMVSMHKADYEDKLPYSESLKEELEMPNEYCELEEGSSFKRSFDDFLKDAQVVLVDDARTFDINKWEQELEDEINEELGVDNEEESNQSNDTTNKNNKIFIKYKLDKEKVKKIVDKIISSDIDITDYWKTKQFLKKYNLVKDDLKEVVKELKEDDYKTNSIETNDLENEAMIFIKNSKVKDLGPFKLFIKIDYDSIEDTPVVVISFHQAKRNRKKNEYLETKELERSKEYDSEGNQLTKAQAEFFKDSKIRDNNGNLLIVNHGTNATFNVFSRGDIGYHFGTKKQAQEIIDKRGGGHIDQYYLNIKKYLYFNGDPGTWGGVYLFDEFMYLVDDGLIDLPESAIEKLTNCEDLNNFGDLFKSTLIENGYDGVVYRNTFEAHDENGELDLENAEDSFIAFYPNQIKAITNKEPSNSDNINESLLKEAKVDIDNFISKFGEDTYNNFLKAKDRLKQKGYSTDITYYFKNFEKDKLIDLLASLYDEEKDSQKQRIIKGTDKEIRGKYNYLGEKDGYKVYQPLDYLASMDLGVNTGWCTTGRYGHYGHPEYTPSEKDAEKHWKDYTSSGIKFYYFLDSKTMYGKYALALYPRTVDADKKITPNLFLKSTNFELFNDEDGLDYSMTNSLPIDLIKDKVEVDFEELTVQTKMIKLNSGKEAYLVVYNQNPLVIGLECETPKTTWVRRYDTLYDWYEKEVPNKLKKYLKKEDLHNLCCENILDKLENWMEPIDDKSIAFRLHYFPSVPYYESCAQRQYYYWYWLDNAYSYYSDIACSVYGGSGGRVDGYGVNYDFVVRPTFFNVNPEILKEFNIS